MPTNGMSSSAAALRYWERRQAVLTHNLANAETAGFKAERVFARMIDDALPVADTATDLRAGALTTTGSPGDLALEGDGFFRVETPAGERWTRGGSFRPDAEGRLVDPNGNPLLGEGGPIEVGSGDFTVAPDGTVRAGGQEVGRLRLERAAPGARLVHEGGNLLVPDPNAQPAGEETRVRQGHREASNVSTLDAMVDMIGIQRAYASVQKAMVTLDEVRDTISNGLARPI
jgi:flagellar basal-body rod protein FlgF